MMQDRKNPLELMVKNFHKTFGHPAADSPTLVPSEVANLRVKLIAEELDEYWEAVTNDDLKEVADAIGDMLYVVIGTAVAHGVDINSLVAEIHESNMSKLQDGKPIYHPNGKVKKGDNFREPDILQVLEEQGWKP